jgi:hypothetical protein
MRSDKWGHQFARHGDAERLGGEMLPTLLSGPRMVHKIFVAHYHSMGNANHSAPDAGFRAAAGPSARHLETIEVAWDKSDDFLRTKKDRRQKRERAEIIRGIKRQGEINER